MKIRCPIIEETIKGPCVVRTCMWWSTADAAGCMAQHSIPEPEELTDEIIAKHKGVPVHDISILRKRGTRTIERVLILYRYLDWIAETLRPRAYPYVEGYTDPILQQYVNQWCANRWPYNVSYLDWNIGKVYCSVSSKLWKRYLNHTGMDMDGLRIVNVNKEEAQALVQQFKQAAARAASANV